MAYDRVVDSAVLDSYLTSIASSIRSKTGKMTTLSFPAGFVDAINAIPVGGGPGGLQGYKILTGSFTESGDYTGSFKVVGATAPIRPQNQGFLLWSAVRGNYSGGSPDRDRVGLIACTDAISRVEGYGYNTGQGVAMTERYGYAKCLGGVQLPNGIDIDTVRFDLSSVGVGIVSGQQYNWVYVYKE